MWTYQNGNYTVVISDDGTKKRMSSNPQPIFPESIDVKITNKCNAGCKFCHEESTPDGKSFDVNLAHKLFKDLPRGVEVAIGGGNPLECKQDLRWLFRKTPNLIHNLTINAIHLPDLKDIYPNAVGISYKRELHEEIKTFASYKYSPQTVIHLIAGVHLIEDFERCVNDFDRVLVLGYKHVGRGVNFHDEQVDNNLLKWKQEIGRYFYRNKTIVFDNLAINQLDIKRFFRPEKWDGVYMGDDGEFTMYLDLVEKKYAVSSRSAEKYDIGELTIKEMFKHIRQLSDKND